uniref:Uncharacterized protein n=1 Tax=viral metagenome TaxID=1070528 RepID=A0A6M3IPQ1_9ZZZZ
MEARDYQGSVLFVGDRVLASYTTRFSPIYNLEGTILRIEGDTLGVQWDNFRSGHSLGGMLEGEEASSGYNVLSTRVTKIEGGNLDLSDIPEAIKQLVTNQQTSLAIFGGKVYNLKTGEDLPVLEDFLAKRENDLKIIVSSALTTVQRLKNKLENERTTQVLMPIITRADIEEGIYLFFTEEKYHWRLPFIYAPLFCSRNTALRRIPEDVQETLKRECEIEIQYDPIRAVLSTLLLTREEDGGEKILKHYHTSGSYDCLGDFRSIPADSVLSAKQVRDGIQELFKTVNFNSLGRSWLTDCDINSNTLWTKSIPIDTQENGWAAPFSQGSKVKVIGTPPNFPENCIGSIGVSQGFSAPGTVCVRFIFTHPSFMYTWAGRIHKKQLANIPTENLEILPDTARRTRYAGRG